MLIKIKQKITSTKKEIQKLPNIIKLTSVISLSFSIFILFFIVNGLQARNVQYSYSAKTCIPHLTFLPDFFKTGNNNEFNVVNSNYTKFNNLNLFSNQTCFESKSAPKPGVYNIESPLLFQIISRPVFKINITDRPLVETKAVTEKPIPIEESIKFPINIVDKIHNYSLQINNTTVKCTVDTNYVNCPTIGLNLLSGAKYNIKLVRSYANAPVDIIIDSVINTRSDLIITNSSITNNQTIYDNTKTFDITFNKDITSAEVTLTDTKSNANATISTAFNNNILSTTASEPLVRDTQYSLSISKIIARDGSVLLQKQQYFFITSSGPAYLSTTMPSYGMSLSGSINLNFDQEINESQNIYDYIKVSGVSMNIFRNSNKITLAYTGAPACTNISISIKPGLKSNFGYVQNKSWTLNSKTLCQTTSSIGQTSQGRSITAYKFGNGSDIVLYIGSIHGNEYSTKYLMDAWVDELEKNYNNIPQDKTVVVIPALSLDGVVSRNRYNAHGIDLNRNFPSNDWQTDVYTLNNQLLPGGGGITPLSEPESQALANYTLSLQPKLILSFHSAAGYVISNQSGGANSIAVNYSNLSGYRNMTGVDGGFSYSITGTYDDWLHDKHNLPSLIIELSSNSDSQFNKNKAALWAMLSI